MKAFLMYRDRDSDPQQILARRERELRPRDVDREPKLDQLLPWNQAALTQDLGLDILLDAMASEDRFLREVAKVALLSSVTDVDTILYRQQVLRDCLSQEALVRNIYQLVIEAIQRERKNHYLSYFSRYPSSILSRAVEVMQMFVEMLRRLRSIADNESHKFKSEGFSRLFSMLREELGDAYFDEIDAHLHRLRFNGGVLISATLGRGNKGKNYVLRKPHGDKRGWFARLLPQKSSGYTYRLHPRDDAGAKALSALRDQGVNLAANALAQSADHILSFFNMLRTEIAFYIGCLNLQRKLGELSEPMCFPVPVVAGATKISFVGLYDVCLALSMHGKVVGNDLDSEGKTLFVITGANTGGKSTFMRSVGLAQLMMQAGMPVPAERFSAEIRGSLLTHYRREEDAGMESGKLDEELSRISGIVDRLTPGSMVLFNESFAATNEREGSEIARQITNALIDRGVKVFFVTHLYDFAHSFYERKLPNAVYLRAERRADGTRPFRLIEGAPLQTSYGKDLYDKVFEAPPPNAGKEEPQLAAVSDR